MRIGCSGGCRWPSPISRRNGSRASRSARRSRPAACSARFWARGRPAAPPSCWRSRQARGTRSLRAGASAEAWARCRTRSRTPRARPARRSGPGRCASTSRSRMAWRPASSSRPASRSGAARRLERRSTAHAARAGRSRPPYAGVRPPRPAHPHARHARESQLRGLRRCRRSRALGSAIARRRCLAACGWREHDAIERAFDAAKYGRFADEPWIELAIPSIADPALAPAGQHVVSAYVQFAPFQPSWHVVGRRARSPRRRRDAHHREVRAGLRAVDCGAGSHHAARSRARLWLDRRPHFSRRARARSAVRRAAAARLGALSARRSATCTCADRARIRAPASTAAPAAWLRG